MLELLGCASIGEFPIVVVHSDDNYSLARSPLDSKLAGFFKYFGIECGLDLYR